MLKQATQLTCTKVPSTVDQQSIKVLLSLYLLQRQMSQQVAGPPVVAFVVEAPRALIEPH
jgi:hypothetical protein